MSRKLIGITAFTSVVLALVLILTVLLGEFWQQYQSEKEISEYLAALSRMDEETLVRHQTLARWYNFCLNTGKYSEEIRNAYGIIWDVSDGMMGYLELPGGDIRIPVYHNALLTEDRYGAGHVPGSAFPLGGRGNHTVLRVPAEAAELERADIFSVHTPAGEQYYCVREVRTLPPGGTEGLLPVEGEDLCTLSATLQQGAERSTVMIHGVRCEAKPEVRLQRMENGILRDVFLWMIATLALPAAAGSAGFVINLAYKKLNCKRLTKKMG